MLEITILITFLMIVLGGGRKMFKKQKKCSLFGHAWRPLYITGEFEGIEVKFIACFCDRCDFGRDDIHDAMHKMSKKGINTYEPRYYIERPKARESWRDRGALKIKDEGFTGFGEGFIKMYGNPYAHVKGQELNWKRNEDDEE